MDPQNLYCSKLFSRISELSSLKIKYEENLETSTDVFDFKRDYTFYQDIKSDLKYKHNLYRRDCLGFGDYLMTLMKS